MPPLNHFYHFFFRKMEIFVTFEDYTIRYSNSKQFETEKTVKVRKTSVFPHFPNPILNQSFFCISVHAVIFLYSLASHADQ